MSRRTLLAPLVVAVVAVCICLASLGRPAPVFSQAPDGPTLVEPVETTEAQLPAGPRPVEVLRAWDARRAEAWARGDPQGLSVLYTPGSVAGRRDRAMLRAWLARGLVVRGLSTQLIAVRELTRTRSTWILQVTDRLTGGVAVGRGVRRPLPIDAATTRTVELRRMSGHWLVAAVSAPTTAGG